MYLRKSFGIAAAVLLAIALAQVDAAARGFGGSHSSFSHGFSRGHDFHHFGRHDFHNHHWAMHDFHHWDGRGLSGHFGHWEPGHWHVSSGFGGHDHWSPHLQGVWGL
jgi:hypothetical protein